MDGAVGSFFQRFLLRIWKISISLQLAVTTLTVLTLSLAAATILESKFDTPTAQYYVYRTVWFRGVLFLLGINILCVALSRWPWKKRHYPFLLAHAGILLLLIGSWVTYQFGIDGQLRLVEGGQSGRVELPELRVYVDEANASNFKAFELDWVPEASKFRPFSIHGQKSSETKSGLVVDEFLPHADFRIEYEDSNRGSGLEGKYLRIKLKGGPMKIEASYDLFTGRSSGQMAQAGPAMLFMNVSEKMLPSAGPWIHFSMDDTGKISFQSLTKDGSKKLGPIELGVPFDSGFNKLVEIKVTDSKLKAFENTWYEPSRIEFGMQAPPSAIKITDYSENPQLEGPVADQAKKRRPFVWLGLGERASYTAKTGKEYSLAYSQKQIVLPFELFLKHFQVDFYPGTMNPKEFSSIVDVASSKTDKDIQISMNNPLHQAGLTFYQASYEPPSQPGGRSTVSILSVNKDPGRWLKYIGSLLLVCGIIFFYFEKNKLVRMAHSRS